MTTDVTDIDVHLHITNCNAVLVSETGDRDAAEWLPLASIQKITRDTVNRARATLTMPVSLAIERGLA